ncbi:MAG: discoidin domain-containing protein, partial [Clostridia bacterium]|nr:discoidin domain-containing protein [Clostridia bacterium]
MKKILIFALSLLIMVGSFSATSFAAEADTTGKTNYALTGEVIARPNCYTSNPVTLLNDGAKYNDAYVGGNSTTEGKNPGFTMDLKERKYIDTVCVYHRSGYGMTYTVSVSDDNSTWIELGTTSANETVSVQYTTDSGTENMNTSYTALQFNEVKARYVKLTGTKASKHRAMEIEVWGTQKTNIATDKEYDTSNWWSSHTNVNDGNFSTLGMSKSNMVTSYR